MHNLKKLYYILSISDRKHVVTLLTMMSVMAVLDMIGVASIFPFIAVLSNPDIIQTNFALNHFYKLTNTFGIKNEQQFLIVLGSLVFILLIFSISFKAFTNYMQIRFMQKINYNLSKNLIEGYLYQPYSWFLNRNSAHLGKNILSEIQQMIGNGLRPTIDLVSHSLVAIMLIVLLITVDVYLTILVFLAIGSSYLFIYYFVNKYLEETGSKNFRNNTLRFTIVNEAFGGIKEIKVGNLERFYNNLFAKTSYSFTLTKALLEIISQLPRYILEIIIFGGVLLTILYLMAKSGSLNQVLPVLSLYIFAGYRLMPSLQQIYRSFTQISFAGPSIDKLYRDLKDIKKNDSQEPIVKEVLPIKKYIKLSNVYFSYPYSSLQVIKNLSLQIDSSSITGFIGPTGSGKTTIIDIILGLLQPEKGTLEVDGKIISNDNLKSWQKNIGYVPQNIFLSDDTIAANIAFGVEQKNINFLAVQEAAKQANIYDYIIKDLPQKFQTTIGERGIRLSGGQRQRIGIARALYNKPKVLILDEATSSLDNDMERKVMDEIYHLRKDITIIIIAHRLNTIKNCDKIFLIKNGELINEGTYENLFNSNKDFTESDIN